MDFVHSVLESGTHSQQKKLVIAHAVSSTDRQLIDLWLTTTGDILIDRGRREIWPNQYYYVQIVAGYLCRELLPTRMHFEDVADAKLQM